MTDSNTTVATVETTETTEAELIEARLAELEVQTTGFTESLEPSISANRAKIDKIAKRMDAAERRVDSTHDRVGKLEADMRETTEQVGSLAGSVGEMQDHVEDLRAFRAANAECARRNKFTLNPVTWVKNSVSTCRVVETDEGPQPKRKADGGKIFLTLFLLQLAGGTAKKVTGKFRKEAEVRIPEDDDDMFGDD